jgi:hypothetical protein
VINLLGGRLQEVVARVPEDLLLEEERSLCNKIRPTPTDFSIRTGFWKEYERVVKSGKTHMITAAVFSGVCSDSYFYNKFLKDEARVAWMLHPVQGYMREIEAVLTKATSRLWELVDMDITYVDRTGTRVVDPKRASVLLEAIKMIENRAQGMAVQRNISKSVVANVSGNQMVAAGASSESLDKRIKELEEKASSPKPIEAEVLDV